MNDPGMSAPNDGRVASRPSGRRRRQAIIDAAKAILIEKGYSNLVMRSVAERAGIQIGNLHYYFPTKQKLLHAIFDQQIIVFSEGVQRAVRAASSRAGRLTAIVDAGLAEIRKPETALWRVLIALAQHDPLAAELLNRENRVYYEAVAEELQRIEPALSEQRARHIARLLSAILDGLTLQIDYGHEDRAETRALENEARAAILALVDAP